MSALMKNGSVTLWAFAAFFSVLLSAASVGCTGSGNASNGTEADGLLPSEGVKNGNGADGANGAQPGPVSIARGSRSFRTDALIYNGAGTWAIEVASLEKILEEHGASYHEVSSAELNRLTSQDLAEYGAIIWPGGLGATMSASLTTETKANLREAVQSLGVGYLGFCAGAFVAVAPTPSPGRAPSYGIGVLAGMELDYYELEGKYEGTHLTDMEMTTETFADGTSRDLVWYGGPVVPSAPGIVVAKYPNGDAAISQQWSGNGMVVLCGPHPAAPQSVRDGQGLRDSDGTDFDLAWRLIDATIHQRDLPVYASL